MAENRFAHGAFAPEAADEPASLPATRETSADAADDDSPGFASEAEENAYWSGVADGIRTGGGTVPPRLAARAAGERLLDQAQEGPPPTPPRSRGGEQPHGSDSPPALAGGAGGGSSSDDTLAFDPVALRPRSDGWTPAKQREFVEALADTGIIRAACARVGMSESSLNRLRRRAEARTFDRACGRAMRIGARRIVSIAYERAIEGTVRRHYFHGELKAEERVYDNRLLIALLGKLPDPHARDALAEEIADSWEPWMDAVEQGLPAPPRHADCLPVADPAPFEASVWQEEDGQWVTDAPPPPGFDGTEEGDFGERYYFRTLTAGEEEWWLDEGLYEADADPGFMAVFYRLGRDAFLPRGHALSAPSEPSPPGEPA